MIRIIVNINNNIGVVVIVTIIRNYNKYNIHVTTEPKRREFETQQWLILQKIIEPIRIHSTPPVPFFPGLVYFQLFFLQEQTWQPLIGPWRQWNSACLTLDPRSNPLLSASLLVFFVVLLGAGSNNDDDNDNDDDNNNNNNNNNN